MRKLKKPKKRTAPFDVPGLGLVPMLYIEAWAVYEAFRRLGFKDEEVTTFVADNMDTGMVRRNVLHVILRAQDKEFSYAVLPIDRLFTDAQKLMFGFIEAIADHRIDDARLKEMYRSTEMGSWDGSHFAELTTRLMDKGFRPPAITN